MTDPIVKQALQGLVDVIKDLTALVDKIDKRLYNLEYRVGTLESNQRCNAVSTHLTPEQGWSHITLKK